MHPLTVEVFTGLFFDDNVRDKKNSSRNMKTSKNLDFQKKENILL